jgi:hypothetical protein
VAKKEKVVVAKRGCTCCGTGCVLLGAVMPLSVIGLWEVFGVFVALAAWPTVLAGAHGVRYSLRPAQP